MVAMFGQAPRVYEDIIDVNQDEAMEVLSEHLMHEVLEYGGGVDKAVRHYQIFVVATKAVFHSSPSLIRMRLYALRRSSLVKIVAPRRCSRAAGTRGSGYRNLTVMLFNAR